MGSLAWSGSRAGGNVWGERARPEFLLEGAKAEVQGRRVRVRRANPRGIAGVGRGESGVYATYCGSGFQDRGRKESKRWKKRARKSLHVAVNEQT